MLELDYVGTWNTATIGYGKCSGSIGSAKDLEAVMGCAVPVRLVDVMDGG